MKALEELRDRMESLIYDWDKADILVWIAVGGLVVLIYVMYAAIKSLF